MLTGTLLNVARIKGIHFTDKKAAVFVLTFGLLALFFPILLIEVKTLRYTGGVFMYPLDDTFIHLEMAKHVSDNGNWGINNNEFGSASSSLLYTIILALGRLFSHHTIVPFIVNCIAGIFTIQALHLWFKKHQVHPYVQVIIIIAAIVITPLPTMIISGMEHTIQCLVSFLFIFHFSDWLEQAARNKKQGLPWQIFVFALLVTSIRYEGLILIAIAGVLLLYYKKWRDGFLLGGIAILPIIAFGIYSLTKGGYLFPNSVLVKSGSGTTTFPGFISNVLVENLLNVKSFIAALATQRWTLILPLSYLLFRKYMRPSHSFILIFLMICIIIQLGLDAVGWLYRYEAYLFFCSTVITAFLFFKYGKQVFVNSSRDSRIVLTLLLFFLFFLILLRSATAINKVGQACRNIYDQQYQMAQFSKRYYDTGTIAANDIGAVSYYSNATITDLWGLASTEVTRNIKNKNWTPKFLDSLCKVKRVEVAMIYDSWFSDSLTNRWKKLATWQIQNNVICGDDIVSFYSVDTTNSALLVQHLRDFQPSLPTSIQVKYY